MGAAALALEAHGKCGVFAPQMQEANALELKGLSAYRAAWRELSAAQR
jgi:hypothetical protein